MSILNTAIEDDPPFLLLTDVDTLPVNLCIVWDQQMKARRQAVLSRPPINSNYF